MFYLRNKITGIPIRDYRKKNRPIKYFQTRQLAIRFRATKFKIGASRYIEVVETKKK